MPLDTYVQKKMTKMTTTLLKLLPLITLAAAMWTLNQLVSSTEGFCGDQPRLTRGTHNITPKHQPQYTLADGVGLPFDGPDSKGWSDRTAAPCERGAGNFTPCSGGPEGMCRDNGCGAGGGWQNTVSRDCTGDWASHTPDGTMRQFKMPNYYGWGTCGGNSYGEPYYGRAVKY